MSAIGQHHHEDDDNSNQRKKPSSRVSFDKKLPSRVSSFSIFSYKFKEIKIICTHE